VEKDLNAVDVGERAIVLAKVVIGVRLENPVFYVADLNAGIGRVCEVVGSESAVVERNARFQGSVPDVAARRLAGVFGVSRTARINPPRVTHRPGFLV